MLRYCETKQNRLKIMIAVPQSSYLGNFSMQGTVWNTEGYLYQRFRYCETIRILPKIMILQPSPLPKLIHKIFRCQKSSELQNGSSTKCFRTMRQNDLDGNSGYSSRPLIHRNFCNRFFLKHWTVLLLVFRCCETKMFPTVKHDRYHKNSSQASLDITNFLKHRKVPLWNPSLLWDETISTENRDNSTRPSHFTPLIH